VQSVRLSTAWAPALDPLRARVGVDKLAPMSGQAGSTALLALCMSAPAFGCGDPRDVQLPLPLPGDPMATPTFARATPQAFASIDVQSLDGTDPDACPLNFALVLGSICDRVASEDGTCSSFRGGDGSLAQCLVHPRSDAPGVYDVALHLEHTLLPTLAVTGSMSDAMNTSVTLQVTTSDQVNIGAECGATTSVLRPGVVRFRLAGCTAQVDGRVAAACDIELNAGFENCAR
jgi:hypothetical protein